MESLEYMSCSNAMNKVKDLVKSPKKLGKEIYSGIVYILQSGLLFKDDSETAIMEIINQVEGSQKITEKFVNSLKIVTNDNPELIINLSTTLLKERQSIYTLLHKAAIRNTNADASLTIANKMENIALFWELHSFYRVSAYLLSGCHVPFERFDGAEMIFGQFNELGLTSKRKDILRHLRHAANHKYSISTNGQIIGDRGDVICSVEEIDELHNIVKKVNHWFIVTTQFTLTYMSSYSKLVLAAFFIELKGNWKEYKSFWDSFGHIIPDFDNPKKHNSPRKSLIVEIWKKYLKPVFKNSFLKKAYHSINTNIGDYDFMEFFALIISSKKSIRRISREIRVLAERVEKDDISISLIDIADTIDGFERKLKFINRTNAFDMYKYFKIHLS